jgi:hypothetical protein
MRRLFLVVLLLALAGGGIAQAEEININRTEPTIKLPAEGINIKGKWGLGVGTGDFLGSKADFWVIRGKTTRTALLLYVRTSQSYTESWDSQSSEITRSIGVTLGPGFRRYTRPREKLSPYWDVNFTFGGSRMSSSGDRPAYSYKYLTKSANAGVDLSGGVEYFFPWHFSLAAHTSLCQADLSHTWSDDQRYNNGWMESLVLQVNPTLHLRVYF